MSFFTRGSHTLSIPFAMHKHNRERLCSAMKDKITAGKEFVLLKGMEYIPLHDTDVSWHDNDAKQESNFQWLFGVKETDVLGAIDLRTTASYLFIPRVPDSIKFVLLTRDADYFSKTYEVDHVHYIDEAKTIFANAGVDKFLTLDGVNPNSGLQPAQPTFEGIETFTVQKSNDFYNAIAELRLLKSDEEMKIMQFVNDISSLAHVKVHREAQREDRRMQYHAEAEFRYQSFLRGCARTGYGCIGASGSHNATLHYMENYEKVAPGDLRLLDMGAEYHGYTADITCTFPVNPTFSKEQAAIYNIVLDAVKAVEDNIKPGKCWVELHKLSERVMLQGLIQYGMLSGDIEEMIEKDLMATFMPHGLGHPLGLDVHDVAGYLPGEDRSCLQKAKPFPVTQNLRLARPLQHRMVVTVEPGIYFIPMLLDNLPEDKAKFVNLDMARSHIQSVGGVRIEDNVFVSEDGCRVLTNVPRTVKEIEDVIAGGEWEICPAI
eukprot:TRINITY_DN7294_c0_g1_i1.p1 TRINITY_DN7294_c0_g1~~TRINITY_DN7294_c0_g1_i1.p1  ORF type:complete len:509 (+),score=107.11 TRINITY_DN7294_c0_g1_i1:58-1527(+)